MMKNQTRNTNGFTLIELIVSIAIIAILAAVVIPTVSGFIFRAQLSADRTEVAAINNALIAYEIDDTLTRPTNLFEAQVLLDTLTDGQLRDAPRTSRRGYYYWFDLEANRLKLFDVDGLISYYAENPATGNTQNVSTSILAPLTNQPTFSADSFGNTIASRPEGFLYTPERPVILIQTTGSPLAQALDLFYRVETLEDYQRLHTTLNHRAISPLAAEHLSALLDSTVFVTEHGMFRNHNTSAKHVVFADGVSSMQNYVINVDGQVQPLSETNPLAILTRDLILPDSINHIPTHALLIADTNSPYQIVFNRSLEVIADIVEAGFTNHTFRGLSQSYRLLLNEETGKSDNIALSHRNEPLLENPLFSQPETISNSLHYIFDETFPALDFYTTHRSHWNTSAEGLIGRHGIFSFDNHSRDYSVTVQATLSEGTNGGFGVLIETRWDGNDDTGLAVQFDRGLDGIAIRTRLNGNESHNPVHRVRNRDNEIIPSDRDDAWWTETVEMRLDVRTFDEANQLMALDVYINDVLVIEDFIFETTIENATENHVALRAWTLDTLFHSLTIDQSIKAVD